MEIVIKMIQNLVLHIIMEFVRLMKRVYYNRIKMVILYQSQINIIIKKHQKLNQNKYPKIQVKESNILLRNIQKNYILRLVKGQQQ